MSESSITQSSDVSRVAAALQKQASRDLFPIWQISATVDDFDALDDVPTGYWPVLIMDNIDTPGAAGIHEDKNGQPFCLPRIVSIRGPFRQATKRWRCLSIHPATGSYPEIRRKRIRGE